MPGFRRVPPWAASSGLVIMVAGTFLPWLHSGTVERSSYQAADSADRLALFGNGFASAALRIWIAVPLTSTACVGLFLLGLARAAATLTAILAISVGTVALLATIQSGAGLVGISPAGPATTLTGAGIALAGALATFVAGHGRPKTITRTGGHL